MQIIRIDNIEDRRVSVYGSLPDRALRAADAGGIFIAESPKVIHVALQHGYRPVSMLCEEKHIHGDAASLLPLCPEDMPVYTGERATLASLTGYTLTRGVLCAMHRPEEIPLHTLLKDAGRVCVLDGVCDTTNIGGIFRSAAALGIDAVLLTRGSCDPLNRRSVRVSMGTVFSVPWGWIDDPVAELRSEGFRTAAMALRKESIALDDPALAAEERLAIIMGTEGDGLSDRVIDGADMVIKIPMANGVDSLNVGAAAAIAFWQLRPATS